MCFADKMFMYNKFNNVYIDMEELQRAMVRYYDLTLEEIGGNLIFVLKLDECQVVKGGQRLERVSLTLMNKALEGKQLEIEDVNVEQVIGGNGIG